MTPQAAIGLSAMERRLTDTVTVLGWQINVLKMRLNSVGTANEINTSRLEECAKAAPLEASGVVG